MTCSSIRTYCPVLFCLLIVSSAFAEEIENDGKRPNILWLSTEDIGPHLGCYNDSIARTPNLDELAKRGMVYDVAWSNYPVCAPARSTIIAGMYGATHGTGYQRCSRPLPEKCKMFPQYLRETGYYCTNASKEDYNFPKPGKVWDDSSRKADYQNRSEEQPFFAVFNQTCTHESQIRTRPHQFITKPSQLILPAYWPDDLGVKKDWAQYYDKIAKMDRWVGNKIGQLEERKLSQDTIIFFFGDHGSGMPRHKRYAGDSGMRVPLIAYFPEKWKHLAPPEYQPGARSSDLVGFVDLAPTMLSLAGIKPKDHMQGRAFAGDFRVEGDDCLFGFRSRMDERPDLSRSIRDRRFVYIRNYMPHLAGGQHLDYQNITPTTKIWREAFEQGKLNKIQSKFFEPHPPEELYDLVADPEETVNQAGNPEFKEVLERFRKLHRNKTFEIRDVGLLPESLIQQLADEGPVRNSCRSNEIYPIEEVFDAANIAASRRELESGELERMINSKQAAIRYWAAIALLSRGKSVCNQHAKILEQMMNDSADCVTIPAAEATVLFLDGRLSEQAKRLLIDKSNVERVGYYSAIDSLNSISRIIEKGGWDGEFPIGKIKSYPSKSQKIKRGDSYILRLVEFIESKISSGSSSD